MAKGNLFRKFSLVILLIISSDHIVKGSKYIKVLPWRYYTKGGSKCVYMWKVALRCEIHSVKSWRFTSAFTWRDVFGHPMSMARSSYFRSVQFTFLNQKHDTTGACKETNFILSFNKCNQTPYKQTGRKVNTRCTWSDNLKAPILKVKSEYFTFCTS